MLKSSIIIEQFLTENKLLKDSHKSATKEIAEAIALRIEERSNPKEDFEYSFTRYMRLIVENRDDWEIMRLFAGVLAFIWVNEYKEPYQPLWMLPSEENKKWWQFWK